MILEGLCSNLQFFLWIEIPDKCFISAEAVDWVCGRIEGVNSVDAAVNLLQRLLDEGYIRHVGHSNKFLFGMFFFCVTAVEQKTNSSSLSKGKFGDLDILQGCIKSLISSPFPLSTHLTICRRIFWTIPYKQTCSTMKFLSTVTKDGYQ